MIIPLVPIILKLSMLPYKLQEIRAHSSTAGPGRGAGRQSLISAEHDAISQQVHVALRSTEGCHNDPLLRLNSESTKYHGIQATN